MSPRVKEFILFLKKYNAIHSYKVNSCLHGCEEDKLLRYINPFYAIHDLDMSFGFPFNWNSTKEGYVYCFILAELWQYKYKTTK